LVVGLTATQAQVPNRSYSFLADDILSLNVTNAIPLTNLNSTATTTNALNVSYTNTAATFKVLTNSTKNLFVDVPLWSLRDGRPAYVVETQGTNGMYVTSFGTVAITLQSQSGANAAVSFIMRPLFGQSKLTGKPNQATEAAQTWTFAVTPTASSVQTFTTNAPMHLWPGAVGLRLCGIINADTDASGAVYLRDISLNGYVPVGP
jgi:hypothetical protein